MNIWNGMRVVSMSDSIGNAGAAGSNWRYWQTWLDRLGAGPKGARGSALTGFRGGSSGLRLDWIMNAYPGTQIATILGNTAVDKALSYSPDAIFIEGGVNDVVAATAPAVSNANYDAGLARIRTRMPTVPILCVSVLAINELWNGAWGLNGNDATIATLNGLLAATAASRGAAFMDVRTPAGVFEGQNNLPANGNTFSPGPLGQILLTVDGIHPTPTAGRSLYANALQAANVVT